MLERSPASVAPALDVEAAETLTKDGFLHLRQVIPPSMIDQLRSMARAHDSRTNIHGTRIFRILMEELQLHRLVQSLIKEKVYYFGSIGVFVDDAPMRVAHLHDDAKGPLISKNPVDENIFSVHTRPYNPAKHDVVYPVWRLFIYLNDHVHFSGGTKIKRGSHRKHYLNSKLGWRAFLRGKLRNVALPGVGYLNPQVLPGDAVLFNHRCKHSGYFVRLRAPFHRVTLPPLMDNLLKRLPAAVLKLIAREFPASRNSLVIDFCTESDWSRGFQLNRSLNPLDRESRERFFDCNDPSFAARLKKVDLPILENPSMRTVEQIFKNGLPSAH
jgi:hypothetical protein